MVPKLSLEAPQVMNDLLDDLFPTTVTCVLFSRLDPNHSLINPQNP